MTDFESSIAAAMTEPLDLPRLYERDIDVLLQEELLFNSHVCALFGTALRLAAPPVVIECRLSVADSTGETDVFAIVQTQDGHRGAMLIENKIDAVFQPRQPERYRERVAALTQNADFAHAICVLVAPKAYLAASDVHLVHFDGAVSYEDIAAAVEAEGTVRARHRAALLRRAVEHARASYAMVPVEEVGALWCRIFDIASSDFPALGMKPPGEKGGNSNWVLFKADLPPKVSIDWKITKRSVELSFWKDAAQRPTADIDLSRLPGGAAYRRIGDTDAICVMAPVPPQQWTALSDGQIREALAIANTLLQFYKGLQFPID